MQYRVLGKTGARVSALGFGCMRFPLLSDNDADIDVEEAVKMVRTAIDNGVNYIDTAYYYHGQKSEEVVGKALTDGYREQVYLATKSPLWGFQSAEEFDTHLDIQLKRLNTDYIDFYLLHAIGKNSWENVILKLGLLEKMEQAKASGKIRFIGFSFHDDYPAFDMILNGYDNWDFCQLQLNYIDTENQAGLRGMREAAAKGLGVIVMEPLLGGRLAGPPENVKKNLPADKSPVETALDYLWNMPEVGTILSGMSTMEQVTDNLTYASRSSVGMLSKEDERMYLEAKRIFETMARVPCTRCLYCMPCPFGVNIPGVFEAYNKTVLSKEEAKKLYEQTEGKAELCQSCAVCEEKCPQKIEISRFMDEIDGFFQN